MRPIWAADNGLTGRLALGAAARRTKLVLISTFVFFTVSVEFVFGLDDFVLAGSGMGSGTSAGSGGAGSALAFSGADTGADAGGGGGPGWKSTKNARSLGGRREWQEASENAIKTYTQATCTATLIIMLRR